MSAIKKVFTDIVALLQANQDATVGSILPRVIDLATVKRGSADGVSYLKDASGKVVAIFDSFYKRWMALVGSQAVEFSVKTGSPTGYNSMSKEAMSEWAKLQRAAKNANAALLKQVSAGEVKPEEINDKMAEIEAARSAKGETTLGFDTLEEVEAYLTAEGVTVAE